MHDRALTISIVIEWKYLKQLDAGEVNTEKYKKTKCDTVVPSGL